MFFLCFYSLPLKTQQSLRDTSVTSSLRVFLIVCIDLNVVNSSLKFDINLFDPVMIYIILINI